MANKARGEVELTLGDTVYRVALSLGTLAEIEDAFSVDCFEDALTKVFAEKASAKHIRTFILAVFKGNELPMDDATKANVNNILVGDLPKITETLAKMMRLSGLQEEKVEVAKVDAPLSVDQSAGSSG